MCGIVGGVGNIDTINIKNLNLIQKHRGPDHQGIWIGENIALGSQRLSIIDINERSNQPIKKNGLTLVFNGEIYNYKKLKELLVKKYQTTFETDSDSEVVLEMYDKFGPKCLDFFEGMFAFAIHEIESKKTFIARDHFGIKPLFYTKINQTLYFASELKTLVSIPNFNKSINKKALISSVNYQWIPGNESIFKNTYKLAPAHYMTVDDSAKFNIYKYWSLGTKQNNKVNEKELINELDSILTDSIKRHLVSDVPISSFLSGGLDSSIITAVAQKENKNISTYTISRNKTDQRIEQMPDDELYAKELAQKIGCSFNEIKINPNIIDILPKIVKTLDEPIGDPAAINTYLMCKEAKEKGVKVILSGMGSDEIFFGYRRQKANLLVQNFNNLPSSLKFIIAKIVKNLPVKIFGRGIKFVRWSKKFLSFTNMSISSSYRMSYSYYSKSKLQKLILDSKKYIDSIYEQHDEIFNKKSDYDLINKMCFTDINMFMVGLNLTYTDRSSMAQSVEVRVPFIDKKLIEYVMTIPGTFKYKRNISKYILKKVAEKHIPKNIVHRDKASFGAPIRSWISKDLKPTVDKLLSEENVKKRGIFNYSEIKKMIDADRKGEEDYAYQIYQLLTIEYWFREFVD